MSIHINVHIEQILFRCIAIHKNVPVTLNIAMVNETDENNWSINSRKCIWAIANGEDVNFPHKLSVLYIILETTLYIILETLLFTEFELLEELNTRLIQHIFNFETSVTFLHFFVQSLIIVTRMVSDIVILVWLSCQEIFTSDDGI